MASTVQALPEMLNGILTGQYIDSDQMDKFVKLLEHATGISTFSVNVIQTLHDSNDIQPVHAPHLQIMFSGDHRSEAAVGHYKVLHYNGREINIYDSLNSKNLTPLEINFIKTVLPHVSTPPNFIRVQEQTNYIDCGIFAIANATSIALGHDPANQDYIISDMRSYVVNLLRNDILIPFPTVSTNNVLELDESNFPNPTLSNAKPKSKKALGRPKKIKRGRPKLSTVTLNQQHLYL